MFPLFQLFNIRPLVYWSVWISYNQITIINRNFKSHISVGMLFHVQISLYVLCIYYTWLYYYTYYFTYYICSNTSVFIKYVLETISEKKWLGSMHVGMHLVSIFKRFIYMEHSSWKISWWTFFWYLSCTKWL